MDKALRELQRKADQGDQEAGGRFVKGLIRSGDFPRIPVGDDGERQLIYLQQFFDYIHPNHHYAYLQLFRMLVGNGIPFRLTSIGRCNCENMACVSYPAKEHDHPGLTCYDCDQPYEVIFDGNRGLARGGAHLVRCINPECQHSRMHGENEPQFYELGPIQCKDFAWRGYCDILGGLCDECMRRLPLTEHSNYCNCRFCNSGIGPLVIVHNKLVDPLHLSRLVSSYERLVADGKNLRNVFDSYLNMNQEDEDRARENLLRWEDDSSLLRSRWAARRNAAEDLDRLQSVVIEVLSDGSYRLRTGDHLNYRKIEPKFKQMLAERESQAKADPTFAQPAELFRYHLLGRDFNISSLTTHLLEDVSPDMREVVDQVVALMSSRCSFEPEAVKNVDPLSYRTVLPIQLPGRSEQIVVDIIREVFRVTVHVNRLERDGPHYISIFRLHEGRPYETFNNELREDNQMPVSRIFRDIDGIVEGE